jgi:3-hydroxyacyl-CoA dehydrogenase/enoyl-CoA hydratase/3-hydroxybutyryl-CoA epimerase
MIEAAGRQAGMPVGPLSLNDEIALDLGLKIMKATEVQLGPQSIDQRQKELLIAMVEKEGRLGRKAKKGFYDYPEGAPKRLWPGLTALQPTHLDPAKVDMATLKNRLLAIQALEASRTVEEGVVTDPREADVGSILGFGFAPYTGGALSYIEGMGAGAFVAMCESLAATHGARFKPNKDLISMAKAGGSFYAQAKKAA